MSDHEWRERAVIDRLASWAVPWSAITMPNPSPEAEILDWFQTLGMTVPPAGPMALRWTGSTCEEIPVDEAGDDDLVISAGHMNDYLPRLEDVAARCVSTVVRSQERFPGPLSWRRWELTRRLAGLLYVSGITRSGGGWTLDGRDPLRAPIYNLPRLSDVWPRRDSTMRPYLLGKRSWWWECHARQGLRLRGRHRPMRPHVLGICAACCPCPECGEPYECGCVF